MSERPASVTRAIRMLLGLVALAGVTALLSILLRDDLLRSWTVGQPVDSSIKPPSFVPVAIVLFVVFAGLSLVLVPFFSSGHNWARFSIAAMVVFVVVSTLAGMRTDPPTVFLIISVVSFLVDAALMFYLWHRDTNAYLRGSSHGSHVDA